jgi:uncharacterized protein (TIGR03000 family)
MSFPSVRKVGIIAVALLGIAVAPGRSMAEQGWPITESRGGSSYSPRYYRSYVPAYTTFTPARVATPAVAATSIRIQVPAQARVWFDNLPTSQTGSVRDFVSPPLTAGREYHYTVRAAWNENGHEIERQQVVSFTPGDPVSIDFTTSMVSVGR